jgi:hypothetical protein
MAITSVGDLLFLVFLPKDFYSSLSKDSNKDIEKQKIQQDATKDLGQRLEDGERWMY